jgi:hypothetical protein
LRGLGEYSLCIALNLLRKSERPHLGLNDGNSNWKRGTLTFRGTLNVVSAVTVRPDVFDKANTGAQLAFEDVAFVKEEDELDVLEELVRADVLPD